MSPEATQTEPNIATAFTDADGNTAEPVKLEQLTAKDNEIAREVALVIFNARQKELELEAKLGDKDQPAPASIRGQMAAAVMKPLRQAIVMSHNENGIPVIGKAVEYAKALYTLTDKSIQARDKALLVKAGTLDQDAQARPIGEIAGTYVQYRQRALRTLAKGHLPDATKPPMKGETEPELLYPSPSDYFAAGKNQRQGGSGQGGTEKKSGTVTALEVTERAHLTNELGAITAGIIADLARLSPEQQVKALPQVQTFGVQIHTLVNSLLATGKTGAAAEAVPAAPATGKAASTEKGGQKGPRNV